MIVLNMQIIYNHCVFIYIKFIYIYIYLYYKYIISFLHIGPVLYIQLVFSGKGEVGEVSGEGGIGFNRPIWHLLTKDLSTSKRKKWRENRIHANGGADSPTWHWGICIILI
jgi:hypothetical protein